MKFSKLTIALLFAALMHTQAIAADKLSIQLPPQKQGQSYEVACLRPKGDFPYLVLKMKSGKSTTTISKVQLSGVKKIAECKLVHLQMSSTDAYEAVVIVGDSDSRRQVHISQILPGRRGLRTLLGTWHEGNVEYFLDPRGNLSRIRLHYIADHALTSDELPGHVYAMRDYTWKITRFQTGPFIADDNAETKASLLELLLVPGSSRIGVKTEDKNGGMLIFTPTGILATKVQPDLMWAPALKAKIGFVRSGRTDYKARLLELSTVTKK